MPLLTSPTCCCDEAPPITECPDCDSPPDVPFEVWAGEAIVFSGNAAWTSVGVSLCGEICGFEFGSGAQGIEIVSIYLGGGITKICAMYFHGFGSCFVFDEFADDGSLVCAPAGEITTGLCTDLFVVVG